MPARAAVAFATALGALGAAAVVAPPAAAALQADEEATAPAARPWIPPRLSFTLAVGTAGIGDLQTQAVVADRLGEDGQTVIRSETLQRGLGTDGGHTLAASATLGLDPAWALRLNLARTTTDLTAGYDGDEGTILDDARATARRSVADLSIFSTDLALLFRIPSGRPFKPYGGLGVSASRWSTSSGPDSVPGTSGAALDDTVLGGVLTLGAVVPIRSRLSAHVELSSRFARTPFPAAPADEALPAGDSLLLTFAAPAAAPFADAAVELTRGLRMEVGVSIELGRATALIRPRTPPPAGRGETSPPIDR